MKPTENYSSVAEIETSLQSEWRFADFVRHETLKSEEVQRQITIDSTVKIHATIVKPGESSGIVKIAEYSAADLYKFAEGPSMEFSRSLSAIFDCLKETRAKMGDPPAAELAYVDFWLRIEGLKKFFGLSLGCDELISVFLTLSRVESVQPASDEKVDALMKVLAPLRNKVVFTDSTLDEAEDILEAAGFDLNSLLDVVDANHE